MVTRISAAILKYKVTLNMDAIYEYLELVGAWRCAIIPIHQVYSPPSKFI
jgi:hypothetical protein